jgi:hypothetical protein
MMKISTLLKPAALAAVLLFSTQQASAQAFTENFDNITLLAGNGWSLQNLSSPVGSTNWFQGTNVAAGGPFDSYNGAANAYIGANYNNTTGANTISNWLMTPNRTIRNGDVLTFYTRKDSPDTYPDRLEVRLSTNGASTNAGATSTTVGDFTTLLLSINPTLITGVYPSTAWTQYTITVSGLSAPMSGRFAFRYFVTNGGPTGANSDYIGIDNVVYTPYVCPGLTVTPSSLPNGTAGAAYSQTLGQTGALGTPTFSVTAGALPPGLTLSASGTISGTPTAIGTYNFTVTVSDASGCSGSAAYFITIMCPTGGASMSAIPAQCANGTPYTLVEGSPAGGTYSGTGVSGGTFNPSAGTQTITYTLIDTYGCTQTANGIATVNTPPTVSLQPYSAVCDNGGPVSLTGGESPAGGTFMGTNVTGNMFDPSAGSQSIMYMYMDANGCMGSATQTFPVNTAPTVTLSSLSAVCSNAGMITLSGESPAGGTFSGTGVTGNMFDPAAGTQTVTYTYTDANSCSNSASQTQTVNAAPTVVPNASATTVCPGGSVTLTGSGAVSYTWDNGVMDGVPFMPAATALYTVVGLDGNGCSDTASITINVNSVIPVVANAAPSSSVCAGASVTLTGSGALTYSWDNGVTDGVPFTPASSGSYIVTGTDANGCNGSDTIMITVNPLPTVTGSATSTTVCLNDGSVSLTGTPNGGTWSGAGVTGTSFSPMTAGLGAHTLTYQYTDSNGCDGNATVTVTVNACTGINEAAAANGFSIYPNPTSGVFNLTVDADAMLVVYNPIGEIILSQNIKAGTIPVDLSAYANGIYLVSVVKNNSVNTVRISKQ